MRIISFATSANGARENAWPSLQGLKLVAPNVLAEKVNMAVYAFARKVSIPSIMRVINARACESALHGLYAWRRYPSLLSRLSLIHI